MSTEIRQDADGRMMFAPDGPQLCRFITANNFVDVIEGPLGSGKTVGLCLRIMRHAQEQAPSRVDGLRKTRWAMVRNTYPALKMTTIRTWLETFPEHVYGSFNWAQPPGHKIKFRYPGGDVATEVDFLALDKPEDIRKLRSGEYTGIAFNELPFISKEIFDEATSRVGRYPPIRDGGPTWSGIIADANAPDEDHWLAMMTGQVDFPPGMTDDERAEYVWPADWGFYLQPAALLERLDEHGRLIRYEINPAAENLKWLPKTYYDKQIVGKSRAWIDSRLMVRVVLVVEGSPVWPMFRVEVHVSREALRPISGHDVTVGLDFGRMPAAIFMQAVNNRVLVQYELLGMNEGAVTFAPKVKRFLETNYPGHRFRIVGDPKGADKNQTDDRTPYDIFASHGMPVTPAPVKMNNIITRVEAVGHLLNEMYDAKPRFVMSPLCRTLKVAMAGRYHNTKDERGELVPNKDRYSNPPDALGYGILGLGEGRRMIGLTPTHAMKGMKVFQGRRTMRRISA